MQNLSYATLKQISSGLGISRDDARIIKNRTKRYHGVGIHETTILYANDVMKGHGVEVVRPESCPWFGEPEALYVNMGDCYITTVVFDTKRKQWYLTDLASWIEKYHTTKGEN